MSIELPPGDGAATASQSAWYRWWLTQRWQQDAIVRGWAVPEPLAEPPPPDERELWP